MWIQVFGLSCLLSLLVAQKPDYNPECNGMNAAAKHLQTGIQVYLKEKNSNCRPNQHCTGVNCTWSGGGFLEIDLHHCDDPVNYHIVINAPDKNIHKELKLEEGNDQTLMDGKMLEIKLYVKELSRQGNTVTTTVELQTCPKLPVPKCGSFPLLNKQKFCVRMEKCPGHNASNTHYKPCYDPTGHSTTQSSSLKISSTGPPVTEPHPDGHTSTAAMPSSGNLDAHKGDRHKDDDSSKMSTATIIGICAAGVFAILIVVAVIVYWKKYHHRSRLRAAYYNDISMHDPLYEDFGPEVA